MTYKHKKRFGQHFLHDSEVLDNIVESADLKENDIVWEIGPGMGALTDKLLEKKVNLTIFEIDNDLIPVLNKKYSNKCNIIHQDILKINWKERLKDNKVKIVSNLPYQISSPLLYKVTENYSSFDMIVLMLQKEVAKRLCANPGKKDYGVLTLKTQYFFNTEFLFVVTPDKFTPSPAVSSGVIKMTPRENKNLIYNKESFWNLIEAAFRNRRKTLRNNLIAHSISTDTLDSTLCPINLSRRGETLSEEEFITLHDFIY